MKKFLLLSDIHICEGELVGETIKSSRERMARMVENIKEEYEREPFEAVLFLGDYSLDFWQWDILGSYLARGECNTSVFVSEFAKKLPTKFYMIPGNHEQYGKEKWKELTGFERSFDIVYDDVVFILLDAFSANLDPDFHSDGTYVNIDCAHIKEIMAKYPEKKIILCAHNFDIENESEEFAELLKNERILCLFAGHDHSYNVEKLPANFGEKTILRTGNYSFPVNSVISRGFRDLKIYPDKITSDYHICEGDGAPKVCGSFSLKI